MKKPVYDQTHPLHSYVSMQSKKCPQCGLSTISEKAQFVSVVPGKKKPYVAGVRKCPGCGSYVMRYGTYIQIKEAVFCVNAQELPKVESAYNEKLIKSMDSVSRNVPVSRSPSGNRQKYRTVVVIKLNPEKTCHKCGAELRPVDIKIKTKGIDIPLIGAKRCKHCNLIYLRDKDYKGNEAYFSCLNKEELSRMREESKEYLTDDEIRKINQEDEKKPKRRAPAIGRTGKRPRAAADRAGAIQVPEARIAVPAAAAKKRTDNRLGIHTFMIKRSVMRCINRSHALENITGEVYAMDLNGRISLKKFAAGYCRECGCYYVLDVTLKNTFHNCRPLCAVADEENYFSRSSGGMFNGAGESLLYQYGYNVSQEEDLPVAERQRILAMLIDYGIMTKTEILSYIRSFIKLRENRPQFNRAVGKWKDDARYIENYRMGEFKKVYVKEFVL